MRTRRKFIRDCSALAASATFLPTAAFSGPGRWREVSLANMSFETFAAQVSSEFTLRSANGGAQPLELFVAERAQSTGDGESFSLFFRGETVRPLGQDTYSFEHPRIGRFDMFIVPIGCEDRTHCYYEAVFNRPSPESLLRGSFASRVPHQSKF